MYNGDRSRKKTLVEHGFRLPSALDNRPLKYDEFHQSQNLVIFTSATPSERELNFCGGVVVEQVVRPTGLLDPKIEIRQISGQIDHLIGEIRKRCKKNERILVTTLTKKMSEDLTEYLRGLNIKVKYLHSDIDSLKRVQILRDLRVGKFDVLVGINLLREGLDMPEVSLVAVLDADKEGFLRSKSSLLQVAGRAARNSSGKVILYGDKTTDAMRNLIETSNERRKIQTKYNIDNNVIPRTVEKSINQIMVATTVADSSKEKEDYSDIKDYKENMTREDKKMLILELKKDMVHAASELKFEKAARIRDEISVFEKDIDGTKI